MKNYFFILGILCCTVAHGQYAPQAGLPGSTAISSSSSLFVGWASQCTVQRGYMDISNPSLGSASSGDSTNAFGMADGFTISLGDSGVATVTFSAPVFNGEGPDFAVFENGFLDPSNDSQAFLELGFVEVSSDGVNYTRFPATSLTPDNVQLQGNAIEGSYIYANDLNNLAGSYTALSGTPFDLQQLAGTPGLDLNNITHIRIVDVVGDISAHSSHDNAGRIVNDPYPTPYPTGGFDLDAVGVINQLGLNDVHQLQEDKVITLYPDPAVDNINIVIKGTTAAQLNAVITTITGTSLQQVMLSNGKTVISVENYPPGMYYLVCYDTNGTKWVEKFIKR